MLLQCYNIGKASMKTLNPSTGVPFQAKAPRTARQHLRLFNFIYGNYCRVAISEAHYTIRRVNIWRNARWLLHPTGSGYKLETLFGLVIHRIKNATIHRATPLYIARQFFLQIAQFLYAKKG